MLVVKDLNLQIGGLKILNQLSFNIKEGSITGLIGPNGAGKSSFYNVLFNLFAGATGSIQLEGVELIGKRADQVSHLGVTRTFQDSQLLPQMTVLENLLLSAHYSSEVNLKRVFFDYKNLKEEKMAHDKTAMHLLRKVGLESKANVMAKNLSYGQSKLIEILKLFMNDSKLILLDEPFSGLFPEMIKVITDLIYELAKSGRTLIFIEHNMKLIAEICDHIIVLDAGAKIAEGTFEEIRKNPEVIEAYLGN